MMDDQGIEVKKRHCKKTDSLLPMLYLKITLYLFLELACIGKCDLNFAIQCGRQMKAKDTHYQVVFSPRQHAGDQVE